MKPYLPSLQTLLAFEAAARHLSFTKAAQELQLTQTAISHQIRNLEDQLGIKLFVRQRNTLILTTVASEYLQSISEAISLLTRSTEQTQRNKNSVVLSVFCLPTYAMQCLVPALADFQDRHPEISVHLTTSSVFSEFNRADYDIAIRYGSGNWPAVRADLLARESFFPVCAPRLLEQLDPALTEEQQLSALRRIRTFYHAMHQDDWPAWLDAAGHSNVRFAGESAYHLQMTTLEAAVAGAGIAIGRTPLVDRYLRTGQLVAPFGTRLTSRSGYYLVSPASKAQLRKVELFRRWALTALGEDSAPAHTDDARADQPPLAVAEDPDYHYQPLAEILARWKAQTPDKLALVDVQQGRRITFSELANLVDNVALQLRERGVTAGERVLLHAEEGLEKVLLWLALWRLAAVVCPIELSRLRAGACAQVLERLQPALILCTSGADVERIPDAWKGRLLACGVWEEADPQSEDSVISFTRAAGDASQLPRGARLHDMASICTTSGTTGDPKFIVYDHKAYWLNGQAMVDSLGLTARDRTLEYRSFDWYSTQILSLMPFLQTGLTLHMAARFSLTAIPRWIAQHQISISVGVPAVINLLLQQSEDTAPGAFGSLRLMTCSTANLATAQWLRFEQVFRVRLLSIYGSSEAGWICSNRHNDITIGTVGYPVTHTEVAIVDEKGNSGPDVVGHISVSGPQLAVGILEADGHITPIRGRRLATNDLGVMDASGRIRVLGRTDDLISRGGIKIPPREIEDIVLTHPDVIDAVVIGVPDDIFGQVPVCFYIPRSEFPVDELLSYCRRNLPRDRVPANAYQLDSLPRNRRGKLLRRELLELWTDMPKKDEPHSAP